VRKDEERRARRERTDKSGAWLNSSLLVSLDTASLTLRVACAFVAFRRLQNAMPKNALDRSGRFENFEFRNSNFEFLSRRPVNLDVGSLLL
jgi:hypothetical protein